LPESYRETLDEQLNRFGLNLAIAVREKLADYCGELERWNQRINLTSLSGAALVQRLAVEPVWIGEKLKISGTLVDIGSGNGSPAVPLCLTRNLPHVHLVEARSRRAAFLRHILARLKIDAEVHRGRFEEILVEIPAVDWISLQAVYPTEDLRRAMRRVSKTTTKAVWITSTNMTSIPGDRLETPFSDTQAGIFSP
jgi:16S rRNA (guanine(527)-N(7))-methyltransferase RsmG